MTVGNRQRLYNRYTNHALQLDSLLRPARIFSAAEEFTRRTSCIATTRAAGYSHFPVAGIRSATAVATPKREFSTQWAKPAGPGIDAPDAIPECDPIPTPSR